MAPVTPNTTRRDDDEDAQPSSILSNIALDDRQTRALRIAVIVMGVLIVLGLLTVIGRIVYLVARPSAPLAVASGSTVPEISAPLPAGARIASISLQGDRLAIHYDAPSGAGIALVDLASGRVVSQIRVSPEAPQR